MKDTLKSVVSGLEGIKKACARAAAQCVPRRLYWGSGVCEGVGFNRRFVMADGSVETHPLSADPLIVRAEGKDSSALHVLAACASFLWWPTKKARTR